MILAFNLPNRTSQPAWWIPVIFVFCVTLLLPSNALTAQDVYYPADWGTWKSAEPATLGFDVEKLASAVQFAKESENQQTRDLAALIKQGFQREPHFSIIGPTKPREGSSGMIIRRGIIAAEWGDVDRVDMTFSVTKSYLSTVAGLALDQGLIRDVHDPVRLYIRDGKFDAEHNRDITWHHLLTQTSDWSGELWGKPDWADRPVGNDETKWQDRQLHQPGDHFKYNDVRVNLLAYCLTHLFRKPLPVVLRENIMDPIGASPSWRWNGYENSWVTIDGQQVQVVSGGGHWGGGMFISTRDHARFGLLFLREGQWQGQQLISKEWIEAARQPAKANQSYGYMWWLNTNQQRLKAATETSFHGAGFGGNFIYVDPDNDLLVVLRWTPDLNGVVEKVLDAINP